MTLHAIDTYILTYAPGAVTSLSLCFRLTLVESIPDNMTYASGAVTSLSTYDAWRELLQRATTSIDLVVFYWTLRGDDVYRDASDWQVRACMILMRVTGACSHSGISGVAKWSAARHSIGFVI